MRKEDDPASKHLSTMDRCIGTMRRGVALKRVLRVIAVVTVLGLVAAACGDNEEPADEPTTPSGSAAEDLAGGTLTMAMLADVTAAFDPQKEYYSVTWEYYRCCLLRNLMSYEGVPTDEGGAEIFPDLAAGEPEQSSDGLTWTYQIKPGIHVRAAEGRRRDHGAGLHPCARADGEPEGERRRVFLLLLGDRGLRRLRRRRRRRDLRPVRAGHAHARDHHDHPGRGHELPAGHGHRIADPAR